jgi:hypothetical protein
VLPFPYGGLEPIAFGCRTGVQQDASKLLGAFAEWSIIICETASSLRDPIQSSVDGWKAAGVTALVIQTLVPGDGRVEGPMELPGHHTRPANVIWDVFRARLHSWGLCRRLGTQRLCSSSKTTRRPASA